jgi:uncharacterized protein
LAGVNFDRRGFLQTALARAGALALLPAVACDVREFARAHGAKLRLSIATGQVGGTYYILGGALAKVITEHIPNVEATAEMTGATGDNLKLLRSGQVDVGYVIGSTLLDAYRGEGTFRAFGRVPVRALAVLYLQPMHVVTLTRSGIARVADLRGRTVSVGVAGSGTEDIALRMMDAAGLTAKNVRLEHLGPAQSIDALKDGKIDACFISAGVPTAAVSELAASVGRAMRLVPSDDLLPALRAPGGDNQFSLEIVGAGTYAQQESDVSMLAVASLLVVDQAMSETLAYEITRVLFEQRAEQAAIHPIAKGFLPERAVVGSPIPFHAGAVRYYREVGAWRS